MRTARFAIEIVLFMLLAGGILFLAIAAARCFIEDEKMQFFVIGYYCAIHNGVVRWIWKKLRIEKAPPS
jgi:hypothetical protein